MATADDYILDQNNLPILDQNNVEITGPALPEGAYQWWNTSVWDTSEYFIGYTVPTGGTITLWPERDKVFELSLSAVDSAGSKSAYSAPMTLVPTQTISPGGIASAEAFGAASINSVITISPTGIASAQAFGNANMLQGLYFYPTAVASAEALGIPLIKTSITVSPTGIASAQALGVPTIQTSITISPTGIASAQAMGAVTIIRGAVTILPSGIASVEVFGVATILPRITISPTGIASAQAFGAPTFINKLSIVTNDSLFVAVDVTITEGILLVVTDPVTIHLVESTHLFKTYIAGPPPDEIMLAAIAPLTRVTRRVDIYEADGTTPFMLDAPFMDGSVTVDSSRDERRMFSLQLYNEDGSLTINPDGFWYDKIIKLYRGIRTDTVAWERKLGEFLIDQASNPHFPNQVNVSGRDMTKKMLLSKFEQSLSFAKNTPIELIVEALAINSGIPADKLDLPLTGKSTGKEFTYDRGTERWKAAKEICTAYGYDLFFTNEGVLTMEEFADPNLGQPDYSFNTGPDGQIESYEKRTADARLYNHIIVTGSDENVIPVWAEAKNEIVGHPTSIARIGDRSFFYTSSFITTEAQAQDVADKFLKVHALEQFEASLNTIVLPWLDAGTVVDFIDPDPADGDPTRYLLSSLTIPLTLVSMPSVLKRVTVVA